MIRRLVATVALLWVLGFGWFMLALPGPADERRTDGIVVLTGGVGRIDRGLALLRTGRARRMLVTGVAPDVRPIDLAGKSPSAQRLFRCCIDLGREAVDTRSNAEETREWVRVHGYRSIRLVTSDWHLRRAELELANALGGEVTVIGDGVPGMRRPALLLAEYNKYLVRRAALLVGLGG